MSIHEEILIPRMAAIKHKVLILSGKGGVGKSTVTTQLGITLASMGYKVGILDIDICGPSIPTILGLRGAPVHQCSEGWVPVKVSADTAGPLNLVVMSIGFLIRAESDAVIWRGPKKTAMIRQFLEDVFWSELDYLLIDTPPGTSDEHIALAEILLRVLDSKRDGAVIVTTPQGVALSDVRKEISFCRKTNIPIIGVVENMSGFVCPCCGELSNIFSSGGGEQLAAQYNLQLLGRIPLDPKLCEALDAGNTRFIREFQSSSESAKALWSIVERVRATVEVPTPIPEAADSAPQMTQ